MPNPTQQEGFHVPEQHPDEEGDGRREVLPGLAPVVDQPSSVVVEMAGTRVLPNGQVVDGQLPPEVLSRFGPETRQLAVLSLATRGEVITTADQQAALESGHALHAQGVTAAQAKQTRAQRDAEKKAEAVAAQRFSEAPTHVMLPSLKMEPERSPWAGCATPLLIALGTAAAVLALMALLFGDN